MTPPLPAAAMRMTDALAALRAGLVRAPTVKLPGIFVRVQCSRSRVKKLAGTKVRIWSNEHGAWWRPDASGYTIHIEAAGVYGFEDAVSHTSHVGPEKKIVLVPIVDRFEPPATPADLVGPRGRQAVIDEIRGLG